jgi:PAS domain-containing protein
MNTKFGQLRPEAPLSARGGVGQKTVLDYRARPHAARAEAQANRDLLHVIADVQGRFIAGSDTSALFDGLLADLLRLTSSEYGFISQVLFEVDGTPYLETRDLTDRAWDEETRERFRRLYRFFNRVVASRAVVISNDPAHDLWTSRSLFSRPDLRSFLGVPLMRGGTLLGVAGIVNRNGGYDDRLVAYLKPFLSTCANLIEAHQANVERDELERTRQVGDARNRAIVDTALDGILTLNEHGIIDHVNPAIERMLDQPAAALIDTHVGGVIPEFGPHEAGVGGPDSGMAIEARVLGPARHVLALRADGTTLRLEVLFSEMEMVGRKMFIGILRGAPVDGGSVSTSEQSGNRRWL